LTLFAISIALAFLDIPRPLILLNYAAMIQFWLMSQPPNKRDRRRRKEEGHLAHWRSLKPNAVGIRIHRDELHQHKDHKRQSSQNPLKHDRRNKRSKTWHGSHQLDDDDPMGTREPRSTLERYDDETVGDSVSRPKKAPQLNSRELRNDRCLKTIYGPLGWTGFFLPCSFGPHGNWPDFGSISFMDEPGLV